MRTLTRNVKDSEARNKTLTERSTDLEKRIEKSMEDISELEMKNNKTLSENDDLKRSIETLNREKANLQALIDADKNDKPGTNDVDNPLKNRLSDLSRENTLLEEKLQGAISAKDASERKLRKNDARNGHDSSHAESINK